MHTGTVKWYAYAKGTGFITDDDGTEAAFVKKQMLDYDRFLGEGQRVSFDVVSYNDKLAAVRVKPL